MCIEVGKERGSFTHLLLFSSKGVGSDPWVWDGDSWSQIEGRQESRERSFQQMRVPAYGIFRLAHIWTLGKETHIAGYGKSKMHE